MAMNVLMVGVGAAGNKAVLEAISMGVIDVKDTCIINSTSKDFPEGYEGRKIILGKEDKGCGKERHLAKEFARQAIGDKKLIFDDEVIYTYKTVIIATSVEGGTGSGSSPTIAKYFKQCYNRNVIVFAFTGFNDDVRGLSNTVEFFKEMSPEISVQTISNVTFLQQAGNNKLKAEEYANKEFATRVSVLTGQDFIDGSQNIDNTDILKLSTTTGYMTTEKRYFDKSLETSDDYEKIIKKMIYNSATIKSTDSCATRIGVILNINENSKDAVDYSFASLKATYGNPYELYTQIQWDGKKEYIAFIVSGMKMPLDEIKAIYEKYKEESEKVNKKGDDFFDVIGDFSSMEEDNQFDMIRNTNKAMTLSDFLNNN